ncbi:hypothetical protein LWE61_06245 [Sphingobium sufflavum]|uniref:hypothetical protein n=1 Tax=Sphingobium sufflavum TaxID=1129547 RepID=UPI001F1A9F78|nr:hypothetical protein [Sphingobium sufflavum]MCE7796162.1 hypothetical protein [Sphingobium sufflavum]
MQMFKRKVLYLGGFDPRGARFYHWLCAEQVTALAGDDAATITDPKRRGGNIHWRVEGGCAADGTAYRTDFECLVWDDLVRHHWIKGAFTLLSHGLRAYGWFISQIDWRAARAVPGGSKVTLFYPGASMLLAPLLVMAVLGTLLSLLIPAWLAFPVALAAGVAVTPTLLKRVHSLWLLRFIVFNDLLARDAAGDALTARLASFADRIHATLDEEEWDEIVFLTHSNGSVLSVPIMADLLARRGGTLPDRFSTVTLGGTIQLIACRRDARAYGAMLDVVAAGRYRWLDIGSLTDGACIPLVDPCLTRPVTRPAGLVQVSPRWFRYSDPATYAAKRRDKYETHFNYLRRLDRPSPLDYIGITCGARPLPLSIAAFQAENGVDVRPVKTVLAHV